MYKMYRMPETRRCKPEDVPPNNGLILNDTYFPEEILTLTLSYLDKKSLSKSRYVCRKWCKLIKEDVWRLKAEREFSRIFANIKPYRRFPSEVYEGICWKDSYGKNLLKNNTGQANSTKFWKIDGNSGDEWKVETPPLRVTLVNNSSATSPSSCFVTSYRTCAKHQIVDLCKAGIHPDILDTYQPDILISEWYAVRWDCGSVYELKVMLQDDKNAVIKDFEFHVRMTNWAEGWKEVNHKFQNYGPGVRSVMFYHSGRDSQIWAGHYGSKMANASVSVDLLSIEGHQYKTNEEEAEMKFGTEDLPRSGRPKVTESDDMKVPVEADPK